MKRFLILIAACGGDGGGPRTAIRATIHAIAQQRLDDEARTFVSPEELAQIVTCDGPDAADWLQPENRRAWIAKAIDRAREVHHIELLSIEPEDQDDPREWRRWNAGDEMGHGCRAKIDVERQKWRIVLDDDALGFDQQPSLPVDVWHWGGRWRLWDDPLD